MNTSFQGTSEKTKGGQKITPPEIRFWKKVNKLSEDECWEWQAGKDKDGYGKFMRNIREQYRAHRYSYELHNNVLPPPSLVVCHSCDNPACVNPKHLFLSTTQGNVKDRVSKNRTASGENHHNSKLTKEQVLEIRKEYTERKSGYKKLGEKYGVCKATLREIIKRKIHKSI